jgi:hypothetical protein
MPASAMGSGEAHQGDHTLHAAQLGAGGAAPLRERAPQRPKPLCGPIRAN